MAAHGILFDFDGTLIDSGAGILGCLRYMLEALDEAPREEDELRALIGVPLHECLCVGLGLSPDRIEEAVAYYRERWFAWGMAQGVLYPGIEALTAELHRRGHPLVLATAKQQIGAERSLQRAGLAERFHAACGTIDGERDKAAVVGRAVQSLPPAARSRALMVGDRVHDAEAAAAHGVAFIAVSYGYGSRDELAAAAPAALVDSPAELREVLLAESGSGHIGGSPVS